MVSCVPESNRDTLCRVGARIGYSADGATVLGKDDDGRDGFSLRLPFDENELRQRNCRLNSPSRHKVSSSFRAISLSSDFLIPGGKLLLLLCTTVLRVVFLQGCSVGGEI